MAKYLSLTTCAIVLGLPLSASAGARMLTVKPKSNVGYVVGGSEVETCQWPTAVAFGGCTGTLVHPKVVTLAAHCGTSWQSIRLGERHGVGRSVAVESCAANPKFKGNNFGDGVDFAYCVLAQEVTDVPLTPIAQGCELEAVKPGASVWVVGFGATAGKPQGSPGQGTKRQVEVQINEVANVGEVSAGGDGKGACHGDSGGPLFMKLPKEIDPLEGWRVIGATSWAQNDCPGEAHFVYLPDEEGAPWIESDSGIDITPCHDALTGEWNPGPDCKEFASDPAQTGRSWDDGCAQDLEINSQCGGTLPDEENPSVEIVDPDDGDHFDDEVKITVKATATDNDEVDYVELFVDGMSQGKDSEAPYQWQEVELTAGEHELAAIAVDKAANQGKSAIVTVTVNDGKNDDLTMDDDATSSTEDDHDHDQDASDNNDDDDDAAGDEESDDSSADSSTGGGDDDDDDDDVQQEPLNESGCSLSSPPPMIGWATFLLLLYPRRSRTNARLDRKL